MYQQIYDYIRFCPECYKRKAAGDALLPSQETDTFFSAPDIAKSHWICVTSVTQYPGTFPQRHTVTQQVATASIQLFSLIGAPGEMVTNQGTNFMSKVMKQQY